MLMKLWRNKLLGSRKAEQYKLCRGQFVHVLKLEALSKKENGLTDMDKSVAIAGGG